MVDGAPHGGLEQDSHPDHEPPLNLEAPVPGEQEAQQPEEPASINAMQGDAPPQDHQELERIGFSVDAT